ncbi:MAG: hypothetical protein MZW92_24605 [Comamonadaceae bacterium]|nr:hypothetical protein [Comamonadaceae bacterium]
MRDEPILAELLVGVTDPTELALLLGIPKKAVIERLAGKRAFHSTAPERKPDASRVVSRIRKPRRASP